MSSNHDSKISIPAPAFELYELVWFFKDGNQLETKIIGQYWLAHKEMWLYQVASDQRLYSRESLEPIVERTADEQ